MQRSIHTRFQHDKSLFQGVICLHVWHNIGAGWEQCLAVLRSVYDALLIIQRKFGLDMTILENAQYTHFSACQCPGYKFIGELTPRQAALSVHGVALFVI
jgi:hypothetical protein